MHINTRIAGIPCIIDAEKVTGRSAAYLDDGHYTAEPDSYDYQVLDRRGRPASWLASKVTPSIERDIMRLIREVM